MSSSGGGQRLRTGDPGKDTIFEAAEEKCYMVTTGHGAHVPVWLTFPLNSVAGLAKPLCVGQGRGMEWAEENELRLCRAGQQGPLGLPCPALPSKDPGVSPTGNHTVSSKTS